MMISCAEVQVAYNHLYVEVRKYIWGFDAVEALVDLELACYKTCIDIEEIRQAFYRFKSYATEVIWEDEGLAKEFDKFEELINSDDTPYAKLERVEEVVNNENNI